VAGQRSQPNGSWEERREDFRALLRSTKHTFEKSSARARDHQSLSSSERIEGTIWQEASEEGRRDETRGGHTHTQVPAKTFEWKSSEPESNTSLFTCQCTNTYCSKDLEYLLVSKFPIFFHDFLTIFFLSFSFLLKKKSCRNDSLVGASSLATQRRTVYAEQCWLLPRECCAAKSQRARTRPAAGHDQTARRSYNHCTPSPVQTETM